MRFCPNSLRPVASLLLIAAGMLGLSACSRDVGSFETTARIPKPAKSQFQGIHPHLFPIHGIDVSKYQGDIDWPTVRASGVTFAYIKATEGVDHLDSKFQQNWYGAKAAGVARGAYHFVYWCRTPQQEIGWFKRNVPVEADALPPVLDVEATPTSKTCKRRLDRAGALHEMRIMLADMERTYGKRPIIYTTVDFYEAILSPNELQDYPIWIRSTKYSPNVRYGDRKWHFWQYQSDGQVAGISGNVDRNAFSGDRNAWLAFASGVAYLPAAAAQAIVPGAQAIASAAVTGGAVPLTPQAMPPMFDDAR